MEEQLMQIKNEALSLILDASDVKTLEEVKLQFLGRSGKLTVALKDIRNVPADQRAEIGKLINEVKSSVEQALEGQERLLKKEKFQQKRATLDITNPGIRPSVGHIHLVTQAIAEITAIFEKIGFTRVRYPEVEWDWYAFTALNFPENHPARDDWETFFTTEEVDSEKGSIILTPHTSNGQIREMQRVAAEQKSLSANRSEKGDISIRMLNIAKTYRRQSDVSHTQMFHQFEGLVVGKDISIVHLKGTLDFFVKSFFGENREIRLRPYHFQFTEPSFELDINCGVCLGKGCKLCKAGWLELGGAGMVHPNVLKFGGVDPKEYSGFAFGFGPERCMMMKEGLEIDDLRLLYSNKLEFLEQF